MGIWGCSDQECQRPAGLPFGFQDFPSLFLVTNPNVTKAPPQLGALGHPHVFPDVQSKVQQRQRAGMGELSACFPGYSQVRRGLRSEVIRHPDVTQEETEARTGPAWFPSQTRAVVDGHVHSGFRLDRRGMLLLSCSNMKFRPAH